MTFYLKYLIISFLIGGIIALGMTLNDTRKRDTHECDTRVNTIKPETQLTTRELITPQTNNINLSDKQLNEIQSTVKQEGLLDD